MNLHQLNYKLANVEIVLYILIYLLCCYSTNRHHRNGIIDNGHFINTNDRYVLCNLGIYYTLSLAEIPIDIIVVNSIDCPVFGKKIFSGATLSNVIMELIRLCLVIQKLMRYL